jgi:hypothetical protein
MESILSIQETLDSLEGFENIEDVLGTAEKSIGTLEKLIAKADAAEIEKHKESLKTGTDAKQALEVLHKLDQVDDRLFGFIVAAYGVGEIRARLIRTLRAALMKLRDTGELDATIPLESNPYEETYNVLRGLHTLKTTRPDLTPTRQLIALPEYELKHLPKA